MRFRVLLCRYRSCNAVCAEVLMRLRVLLCRYRPCNAVCAEVPSLSLSLDLVLRGWFFETGHIWTWL